MDESLSITGSKPNVHFALENIARAFLRNLDGVALDLARIAAFAFVADTWVSRGGKADWRAKGWIRDMHLVIPVTDPDHWRSPAVLDALRAALEFASGDRWSFAFTSSSADDQRSRVLQAGEDESFDCVMLFSGGADSLTAIVEALAEGRRPALVSHEGTGVPGGRRTVLWDALKRAFPDREIARMSASVHRIGGEATERTRRTRSFLFTAIAAASAIAANVTDVRLADNGVVSLNLPINAQLAAAQATRSTHPKYIRLMNELLAATFPGRTPVVRNPLWDRSRTEVLERLASLGYGALLADSVSCGSWSRLPKPYRHCGTCSQCIDRRFAALAAGLEAHDPADRYRFDILNDSLPGGEPRIMAISYFRLARELERISASELVDRFAELADALTPGRTQVELEAYTRMLQAHGASVLGVATRWIGKHANELARGDRDGETLFGLAGLFAKPAAGEFRHSEDFRSVTYQGREFTFTESQSIVVRRLHEAKRKGLPGLSTTELLDGFEAGTVKLSEVFKRSPAWETLIQRDTNRRSGLYRLAIDNLSIVPNGTRRL